MSKIKNLIVNIKNSSKMNIVNFEDFKKRVTKEFVKHNVFNDFYEDIIKKTDEIYIKLKNNEQYTNKSIYITCLLISNKFIMDIPVNNISFSKLFFIDIKKLNNMEIFCLNKLSWNLS